MTARKATKKATKSKPKKATIIKEAMTKTQMLTAIAESTELNKKQIQAVFSSLELLIDRHIKKGGAGCFTLPGLLKVTVTRKPPTKSRKGINPFTGEETIFKAKPARRVVKIRALKKIKDMAS